MSRPIAARVLVALVLLLLLVLLGWQGVRAAHDHRDSTRRASALDVAKAQALDLTTMDAATVRDRLTSMAARTTGAFAQQLSDITDTFVQQVDRSKLKATGHIKAAGLSRYTGTTAEVLIAVTADVTNTSGTTPTERSYRMAIDETWKSGGWLISGMRFVA